MNQTNKRIVDAVIRKCLKKDKDDRPDSEQKWCLYTHDGDRLLGRHPSKEKALKQEQAIQIYKHASEIEDVYEETLNQFLEGKKKQPWKLVPRSKVLKVWKKYGTTGEVTKEDIFEIYELTKENMEKVLVNSALTDYNPEDLEGPINDKNFNVWFKFISDDKGSARYTDQDIKFNKIYKELIKASTPEKKLLAVDLVFNLVHGKGPVAEWFIEGGSTTLSELEDWQPKSLVQQYHHATIKSAKIYTLYHGTDEDVKIDDLEERFPGYSGSLGKGIYFGQDKKTAEYYGKNIIECQVDLKNPLIIDASENTNYKLSEEAESGNFDSILVGERIPPFNVKIGGKWHEIRDAFDLEDIGELAEDAGHDAIIARDIRWNSSVNEEVLVFDKKSIIPQKKVNANLTEQLDKIASEIETVNSRIALAIDNISDVLDSRMDRTMSLNFTDMKTDPTESPENSKKWVNPKLKQQPGEIETPTNPQDKARQRQIEMLNKQKETLNKRIEQLKKSSLFVLLRRIAAEIGVEDEGQNPQDLFNQITPLLRKMGINSIVDRPKTRLIKDRTNGTDRLYKIVLRREAQIDDSIIERIKRQEKFFEAMTWSQKAMEIYLWYPYQETQEAP